MARKKYNSMNSKKEPNGFIKALGAAKFIIILTAAGVLAGYTALTVCLSSQPPIPNLDNYEPNIVTQFYSSDGQIIKTFAAYSYKKVGIKEVPKDFINALLATEDKNFYKHHGYDLWGMGRAMVSNILSRRLGQGASTITQQLARLLFLSNEKSLDRKIKELFTAASIENSISKDKILELYVNNIYLGSGAYGIQAAAQTYFNKPLKELSLPELALIAGLPQAPSVYSPYNNPDLAKKRRNQVLWRMYKMHYINKKQFDAAKKSEIVLGTMPKNMTTNKAPYFCDYVLRELEKLGYSEEEITKGGYKVTTTLNYQMQQAAAEAIPKRMKEFGLVGAKYQAAFFAYDHSNGKILSYVGGKNYVQSQYDRVTQAIRPPGSAFKPFVFAVALEHGYSPNDMLLDMPVTIGDWSPRNYGNKYRGEIPFYTALMVSSNVCAARLIADVGVRSVIQLIRSLGIETPIAYDHTIALGSNGVKLFEFTRAYSAFANGGFVTQPYAVEKIESPRGKILYEAPKARMYRELNYRTAAQMTAIMKTVITSGTGRSANIGAPAAGKTGTTNSNKDAYFVGYTPNVVASVWVGNDDNSASSRGVVGGTVPARIWHDAMLPAVQIYGKEDFSYPPVSLMSFSLPKGAVIINSGEPELKGEEVDDTPTTGNAAPEEVKKPAMFDPKTFASPLDIFKNNQKNNELEKLKEQIKQQQQQIEVQERQERERQEAAKITPAPQPSGTQTLPSGIATPQTPIPTPTVQ